MKLTSLLVIISPVLSNAQVYDFTAASRAYIVNEHNAYRSSKLSYPAANMKKLEWSEEVTASARNWANVLMQTKDCKMEHPDRAEYPDYKYGQNLAWRKSSYFPADKQELESEILQNAMYLWGHDEQVDLVPAVEREGLTGEYFARGFSKYDHYTQIVASGSEKIGCAYARCGTQRLTVCEFDPPGNTRVNGVMQEWYIKGDGCSKCDYGTGCDETGYFCVPGGTPYADKTAATPTYADQVKATSPPAATTVAPASAPPTYADPVTVAPVYAPLPTPAPTQPPAVTANDNAGHYKC